MKKYISMILITGINLSLINPLNLFAMANGVSQLNIIAQSTSTIGEAIDITIRAVDANQNIVNSYRGTVIFNTDNLGDTVPAPGKTITFTAEDNGEKKISKGVIFKKAGKQKLYVSDVYDDIIGELNIIVSTGANNTDSIATNQPALTNTLIINQPPVPIENPNIYTPWELVHRSAMFSGFQWSGEIAKFITPNMYIGTPFADSRQYIGQTNPLASFLVEDATTYRECLQNESYLSYGLGERIEKTDILELKVIAKTCAQQFYGTYFDGKTYTTREEYLMMLMTMFGEDVSVDGEFTEDGQFVAAGPGVESGFENVQANAWYSPYLAYADEIGILSTDEVKWQVARAITDQEAIDMLALYTAYRMGYTGDTVLDRGMIQTESLQYNIEFVSENEVTIRVQ